MNVHAAGELKVLMLEDVPGDADLVRNALRKGGIAFSALCVDTKAAFESALDSFHPDIVLSDYKLPDFDGVSALKMVRQKAPDLPVIVVTGVPDEEGAVELIKAGASDFVLKDRLGRLPHAVNGALAGVRQLHQLRDSEKARRQSEERFQSLVEQEIAGIFILAQDSSIIFVNRHFLEMLEYKTEEVVGRPILNFIPDQEHPNVIAAIGELISGEKTSTQVTACIIRKGGARIDVLAQARLATYDGTTVVMGVAVDISERKRAEAELVASHSMLATTERIAHVGGWDWDIVHDRLTWSEELYRVYGLNPASFVPTVSFFMDSIHPDDKERVREAITACTRANKAFDVEFRIICGDSKVRVLHSRAETTLDVAGKVIRMYGTSHDITEQRRVEGQVREDEARFRSLVEQEISGVYVLGPDASIVYVNPHLLQVLGYEAQEVLGHPLLEFMADEEKAPVLATIGKLISGEAKSVQLVTRIMRKGGVPLDFLTQGRITSYDGKPAIMGVAIDISDRRRAERELQKREQRFRSLINSFSNLVWQTDENGRYTDISPGVKALLGYEPAELIGKTPFDFMSPEEVERVSRIFQGIAAGKHPFSVLENRMRHKDGHELILESSGVPVLDASNRFCGFYGIDRDITQQRRAEEKIREDEVMFRGFVEQEIALIYIIDADGTVGYANPIFREKLGYSEKEVLGHPFVEFIPERDQAAAVEAAASLLLGQKQSVQAETRLLRKSGGLMDILYQARPTSRGGRPAIIGMALDIGDRKRGEQRIIDDEARFRSLVEQEIAGIVMIQADAMIRYANPAFSSMIGFDSDELVGRAILDLVPESEKPKVAEHLREQFQTARPVQIESMVRAKDGRIIDILIHAAVSTYDSQSVSIAVVLDISESKRLRREQAMNAEVLRTEHELSPDGILVVGAENRIISFNKRFCDLMHVPFQVAEGGDDSLLLQHAAQQMADPAGFRANVEYIYAHRDEPELGRARAQRWPNLGALFIADVRGRKISRPDLVLS